MLHPLPATLVAALGLALGIALGLSDLVQRLEWALYDRFMRATAAGSEPPGDILIVAIDEPSFTEFGTPWPWPRRVHAALIDTVARGGARAIVFDILFDVASGSAEDDALLVDAVGRAGNVVLAVDQAAIADRAYSLTQWTEPFPELAGAAAALGVVRLPYDPEGVVRRTAFTVDGRPTLAVAAAARAPGFRPPPDPDRTRLIRFNGPPRRGIVTVSYYQALDAEHLLPRGIFKDKIVFVGHSLQASMLQAAADHFATPVAPLMPGVEIHANIVDTLLRGRAIADPFESAAAVALLCLALGAAVAALFYRIDALAGLLATLAAAAALAAGGYLSFARFGARLPILSPAVTIAAVYAAAASYRFALLSRERRVIRRAFEHYVAPSIVAQMLADPARLRLGGEEYEITVIFTDLEGFTTLAERLTPEQLQQHLSGYFKEMMNLLLAEHATLDKFIGDAIMVYFGCPVREPGHAARACRAALAMQRRMAELNRTWIAEGLPSLRMRVGINTGRAVAGNMGTDKIFNYTVLGDSVNLAARLEGVNKQYVTLIIIGDDTRAQVGDEFELRELDLIRVKGKNEPVAIHELVAAAGEVGPDRRELLERFAAGLSLYRAMRWRKAEAEFRAALAIDEKDGPSTVFLKRCTEFAANPPPAGWDGVYTMTTK